MDYGQPELPRRLPVDQVRGRCAEILNGYSRGADSPSWGATASATWVAARKLMAQARAGQCAAVKTSSDGKVVAVVGPFYTPELATAYADENGWADFTVAAYQAAYRPRTA